MSTQIGPLAWAASQGGAAGSLIAQINLDSSVDTSFVVPAVGLYSGTPGKSIYADGVIIYNSNNNGTVMVNVGPLETDIPPFIRDIIQLSSAQTIMVDFTVGTINLLFYKGTPPVSPTLYNYAGAAQAANMNVFNGPVTGGSPNSQTISVAQNYAFGSGVLVTGTWGFTNTGSLTIIVNGTPTLVTKPTPTGSIVLNGGECRAGTNFVLCGNLIAGSYDLVSNFNASGPFASAYITVAAGVYTLGKSNNVASVVKSATGQITITMTAAAPGTDYRVYIQCETTNSDNFGVVDRGVSAKTASVFGVGLFNAGVGYSDAQNAISVDVFL